MSRKKCREILWFAWYHRATRDCPRKEKCELKIVENSYRHSINIDEPEKSVHRVIVGLGAQRHEKLISISRIDKYFPQIDSQWCQIHVSRVPCKYWFFSASSSSSTSFGILKIEIFTRHYFFCKDQKFDIGDDSIISQKSLQKYLACCWWIKEDVYSILIIFTVTVRFY